MSDTFGPSQDNILSELTDEDFEDLVYGTEMTSEEREEFLEGLTMLTHDDLTY